MSQTASASGRSTHHTIPPAALGASAHGPGYTSHQEDREWEGHHVDREGDDVLQDRLISTELLVSVAQMWTGSHSHGQHREFGAGESGAIQATLGRFLGRQMDEWVVGSGRVTEWVSGRCISNISVIFLIAVTKYLTKVN